MGAPSCSPSWWGLMNDVLMTTFNACPEKLNSQSAKLSGDATRQPEEIMESFFYVLREHLFTLFNVLEEGSPNANHKSLARMARLGMIKAIFTTNFDLFIERALREEGIEYTVLVTDEE